MGYFKGFYFHVFRLYYSIYRVICGVTIVGDWGKSGKRIGWNRVEFFHLFVEFINSLTNGIFEFVLINT